MGRDEEFLATFNVKKARCEKTSFMGELVIAADDFIMSQSSDRTNSEEREDAREVDEVLIESEQKEETCAVDN